MTIEILYGVTLDADPDGAIWIGIVNVDNETYEATVYESDSGGSMILADGTRLAVNVSRFTDMAAMARNGR